jgi:hypothetical protein
MIVQPVSQPGGSNALVSGTAVNFRFRSDSSKYINYRESRLYCRYSVAVGPPQNVNGNAVAGASCSRDTLPPNLRMAACPNSACFVAGVCQVHFAACISFIQSAENAQIPTCPQVFLGPNIGMANIMEFHDEDGRCTVSIVELSTVCSAHYAECLNFLATSQDNTPGSGGR